VPNYHETYREYTVSVEEHIEIDLGSNLVTSVKVKSHNMHISLTFLYMHKSMFFFFYYNKSKYTGAILSVSIFHYNYLDV